MSDLPEGRSCPPPRPQPTCSHCSSPSCRFDRRLLAHTRLSPGIPGTPSAPVATWRGMAPTPQGGTLLQLSTLPGHSCSRWGAGRTMPHHRGTLTVSVAPGPGCALPPSSIPRWPRGGCQDTRQHCQGHGPAPRPGVVLWEVLAWERAEATGLSFLQPHICTFVCAWLRCCVQGWAAGPSSQNTPA